MERPCSWRKAPPAPPIFFDGHGCMPKLVMEFLGRHLLDFGVMYCGRALGRRCECRRPASEAMMRPCASDRGNESRGSPGVHATRGDGWSQCLTAVVQGSAKQLAAECAVNDQSEGLRSTAHRYRRDAERDHRPGERMRSGRAPFAGPGDAE